MKTEIEKLNLLTERTNRNYEAFLYDCDGTLADNMGLHKLSYKTVANKYGVDLDTAIIDELAGWPTAVVVQEIGKRYGVNFPDTFVAEKYAAFFEDYIDQTQPIEFVAQHLKQHAGKVRIAVVSGSGRPSVERTLNLLGLLPFVEVLVCAGETERGKPFPDPFLAAAEKLGVDPSKCLVFEDGQPGVDSAIAAGMDWVRVDKI